MAKGTAKIIMLGVLILPCRGISQSFPSSDTITFTLGQSITTMLENSKSLHASMMKTEAADAKASEASAVRLPSLKFGGSYTRLSEVPPFAIGPFPPLVNDPVVVSQTILNNYSLKASVQHPLFAGFRYDSNVDMTDNLAQSAAQDFTRDRTELIFATKTAYWNLYKSREFRKVVDENVQQMQEHLKDIQNMFDQGLVTKNEVLRVEVQLSDAKVHQIDAANGEQLAQKNFNNTLGIPLQTIVRLGTEVTHQPKSYAGIDTLIVRAIESRPELRSMEYKVKAAEDGVTMALSGWYPQIYLFGDYYYARPNPRIFPSVDRFEDTWDVGISLSWDIWNWGTTIHQTSQARAQLEQANDGLTQLKDGVALEVTQSYLNLGEAKERIGVADKGVAQAEENYRITNQRFKSGLALNSDLIDAEVALLMAKWNHIQALVDFEVSQARLDKSLGITE